MHGTGYALIGSPEMYEGEKITPHSGIAFKAF